MIKLMLVNTDNLNGSSDPDEQQRCPPIESLIRGLDADMIAVQDIIARDPDPATGNGAS